MGSSNRQCRLSGETIAYKDRVVFFMVEPASLNGTLSALQKPVEQVNSHWLMSSLIMRGTYADYQGCKVSDTDDMKDVVAINDLLYSAENGFYSFSDVQRKFGDHQRDKNLEIWIAHEKVFDLLLLHNNATLEKLDREITEYGIESPEFQRLSSLVTKELADVIKVSIQTNPDIRKHVLDALALHDAMANFGMYLSQSPEIARQSAFRDYQYRLAFHKKLQTIASNEPATNVDNKMIFRCALSGVAIGENDKFFWIPLSHAVDKGDWIDFAYAKGFQCGSQFKIDMTASPIAKKFSEMEDISGKSGMAISEAAMQLLSKNVAAYESKLSKERKMFLDRNDIYIENVRKFDEFYTASGKTEPKEILFCINEWLRNGWEPKSQLPGMKFTPIDGNVFSRNFDFNSHESSPVSDKFYKANDQCVQEFYRSPITTESSQLYRARIEKLTSVMKEALVFDDLFDTANISFEPSMQCQGNVSTGTYNAFRSEMISISTEMMNRALEDYEGSMDL
jgi:hypothetical protein